jgi:hypothetical protein
MRSEEILIPKFYSIIVMLQTFILRQNTNKFDRNVDVEVYRL